MKYFIKTFGCQMNKSDSERIGAVLEKAGIYKASEKEADFLIINVCSVRKRAVERVYALVNKWQQYKAKIILTGCLLPEDQRKLQNKVDLFLNIQDINELPGLSKNKKLKLEKKSYLTIIPKYESKFSAFVPVMTGCNNFCSYCVVPYARGREISRPVEEIVSEVKKLVRKEYKEIVLLGQNVNSYQSQIKNQKSKIKMTCPLACLPATLRLRGGRGGNFGRRANQNVKIINFPKLLKIINEIPGDFWIRFITSHPKDMSDELIETIAQCQKVCEYIHLPLQAGDNTILKKMNRKYTVQKYLNLIKRIRAKIPKVTLSTDIIIGFPSETKKQFENTVEVFKKIRFDMAYIAQYSPRPGTEAYQLKDNVPSQEKKRRFNVLNQLLKQIAQKKNQKLVGKTEEVLVEKCEDGFCFGKTRGFKTVKFKGEEKLVKIFAMVKIQKATAWGLSGALLRCLGSGS